jgi:K+-sensing histidine kinase KdpD
MDKWLELFALTNFRRSSDTAHDLKTPLNVAVLNLELLRMRMAKLTGEEDEKLSAYAKSIEVELRRMAKIFDTFFLLSTPPKGDEAPAAVDIAVLTAETAAAGGFSVEASVSGTVLAHEVRIRQALTMFFDGAAALLGAEGRVLRVSQEGTAFVVTVSGRPAAGELELTKIFKFYYTDALGNPDLSLATARLIAETYGGELNATQESDKVVLRLSFPLGVK